MKFLAAVAAMLLAVPALAGQPAPAPVQQSVLQVPCVECPPVQVRSAPVQTVETIMEERTRTIHVPETYDVEENYTVMVPETRTRTVQRTRMVESQVTEQVPVQVVTTRQEIMPVAEPTCTTCVTCTCTTCTCTPASQPQVQTVGQEDPAPRQGIIARLRECLQSRRGGGDTLGMSL